MQKEEVASQTGLGLETLSSSRGSRFLGLFSDPQVLTRRPPITSELGSWIPQEEGTSGIISTPEAGGRQWCQGGAGPLGCGESEC